MSQPAQQTLEQVVIRFAGDSGDGMQLLGSQFTQSTALIGNDIATLPDFPAEIRAPAGTREGVSGFQIHFAGHDIFTHGDETDVLVAMNPAALVKNLGALKKSGIVVVNTDKFKKGDLSKARLESNPLDDGTLEPYRTVRAPITTLTKDTVQPLGLNTKEADRCKNFFALGMMYWLYSRSLDSTIGWVESKFRSPYKEANIAAMNAGFHYAETVELFQTTYTVPRAEFAPGRYKNITGNRALALGLAAAAQQPNRSGTPVNLTIERLPDAATMEAAKDDIAAIFAAVAR